jgi:hypothetical protein
MTMTTRSSHSTASQANSTVRGIFAAVFGAAALLFVAAAPAQAFWLTQPSGATLNGAGITGCLYIQPAPQAGDVVGFVPCSTAATYGSAQWVYQGGEFIAGGLCLEYSSSEDVVVVDTCTGASNQKWTIGSNTIEGTGGCIQPNYPVGESTVIVEGSCSAAAAAWTWTN